MEGLGYIALAVIGVVLLLLFNKGKSNDLKKDTKIVDKRLKKVQSNIDNIKKEIAEKKTGKKMTPEQVEKYWNENG